MLRHGTNAKIFLCVCSVLPFTYCIYMVTGDPAWTAAFTILCVNGLCKMGSYVGIGGPSGKLAQNFSEIFLALSESDAQAVRKSLWTNPYIGFTHPNGALHPKRSQLVQALFNFSTMSGW